MHTKINCSIFLQWACYCSPNRLSVYIITMCFKKWLYRNITCKKMWFVLDWEAYFKYFLTKPMHNEEGWAGSELVQQQNGNPLWEQFILSQVIEPWSPRDFQSSTCYIAKKQTLFQRGFKYSQRVIQSKVFSVLNASDIIHFFSKLSCPKLQWEISH